MKKILSIFLVMLLAVALAVPTFALETDELPSFPAFALDYDNFFVTFTGEKYMLQVYEHVKFDYYEGQWSIFVKGDYRWYTYSSESSNFVWSTYGSPNTLEDWRWEGYISSNDYLVYSTFSWIDEDGTILYHSDVVCDGSSCPANDLNLDSVCDDCGRTLSLRNMSPPSFPVLDGSNINYVLTRDANGYSYYFFSSKNTYTVEGQAISQLIAFFSSSVDWKVFRCTDGKNWVETVSSSGYQYGMGDISEVNILESTITFYDSDGNIFFPVPLWVEMGQVTQGEMGELTNQTMRTVSILVLCGVGCLALLILLYLLGKRSQIFHL